MKINYFYPEYEVVRQDSRCTRCRICEKQCANGVHFYDETHQVMLSEDARCVNCHRCVATCPTRAIKIVKSDCDLKENANWSSSVMKEIYKQAESGGVLLSSMGTPNTLPVYWDKILINASQVTNPSIDPLREPMETKVFLGKQPARIRRKADGTLDCTLPPQLELSMPVMFSAMSYGSISYNAHQSLARAASALGIYYNTGEGGLHDERFRAHVVLVLGVGHSGVQRLGDNLGDGAVGELQDLASGGHGLATNQIDDDTRLTGRNADIACNCFSFHCFHPFLSLLALVGGMTLKGAGRGEFAQLVADHGFRNVYRHVLAAIVHGDGVTHHFREDGARARPGLHDVLLARRIHLLDTIKKARFNERTLLQTSTHYYSLTLCATSCDGG